MGAVIREATVQDMAAVLEINNFEVLNGVATFDLEPRSLEAQMKWFHDHASPYCVLVAEDEGRIVGWGSLSPYSARAGYRFTAEDSVYVHHDHFRRGIGRALLRALVERALKEGYHSLIGLVTSENVASLALHAELGFVEAGRTREVGFKFGRWLDVVTVQRLLAD